MQVKSEFLVIFNRHLRLCGEKFRSWLFGIGIHTFLKLSWAYLTKLRFPDEAAF
jgi:hypothetical protein